MTVYNDYSHLTMSHLEQFDMTEEGALLRYSEAVSIQM